MIPFSKPFPTWLRLCLALLLLGSLSCRLSAPGLPPASAAPTAFQQAAASASPALSPTSPPSPAPSLTPVDPPTAAPTATRLLASAAPTLPSPASCGWPPERALIISVDSLRVDAVNGALPDPFMQGKASAPFLLELSQKGAFTWKAQTVWPSLTLPAHTSMLTGYDVPAHGVNSNAYFKNPGGKVPLPTIFERAHERGMLTAMLAGKKYFYFFEQPEFLDYHWVNPEASDAQTARRAVTYIQEHDFDVMLIHLANVDEAGHAHGWMSPEYLDRVQKADQAVRSVFEALEKKGIAASTLVIINSDHGGSGFTHGDASNPVNRTIVWMMVGPCVRPGHPLAQDVHIYDTGLTALWALGIPYPADVDGRPVWEAFRTEVLRSWPGGQ
jgi:hypothetical protein